MKSIEAKKKYMPACFICTRKNIFAEMIEKKKVKRNIFEIYEVFQYNRR